MADMQRLAPLNSVPPGLGSTRFPATPQQTPRQRAEDLQQENVFGFTRGQSAEVWSNSRREWRPCVIGAVFAREAVHDWCIREPNSILVHFDGNGKYILERHILRVLRPRATSALRADAPVFAPGAAVPGVAGQAGERGCGAAGPMGGGATEATLGQDDAQQHGATEEVWQRRREHRVRSTLGIERNSKYDEAQDLVRRGVAPASELPEQSWDPMQPEQCSKRTWEHHNQAWKFNLRFFVGLARAQWQNEMERGPSARQRFPTLPRWTISDATGRLLTPNVQWRVDVPNEPGVWKFSVNGHALEEEHVAAYKHAYETITNKLLRAAPGE